MKHCESELFHKETIEDSLEPWQHILGSWFPELTKYTDYPDEEAVRNILIQRGVDAYEAELAAQHYVRWAQGQQFLNEHPTQHRQHHKIAQGLHSY